jgi:D-alanyl-D-alanine carboxypeptidase
LKKSLFLFFLLGILIFSGGCQSLGGQPESTETVPPTQLLTGWQEIDGKSYYYLEDGTPITGWMDLGGVLSYFHEDGALATGWTQIGENRYYFDENGAMATGKLVLDGITYLLSEQGTPLAGWQELDGKPCYCSPSGVVAQGFTEIDGKRYYFHPDGSPATQPLEVDGKSYLPGEDGVLYTGWLSSNGYDYYYQEDGSMAVGKVIIDGQTRYFSPKGIHVYLVNPWNLLPPDYDPQLVKLRHFEMSVQCADALDRMLTDCKNAGTIPAICSAYRTQEDQEFLYNRKVNNIMATGHTMGEALVLAAKEVAVPGTSEHQLGLAIDIVDDSYWVLDEHQAETPAQKWLMEHCWEYGFILRYPVGSTEITGIVYEPWHYRYVGVEMAMELRELGITLEEYLGATDHLK